MNIADAIGHRHLLTFRYDGFLRVVEPHTYGTDRKGNEALRAYQVSGGSDSGESIGWKIFHVSDMRGLSTLTDSFSGPRPGYKRGDRAFAIIRAQL